MSTIEEQYRAKYESCLSEIKDIKEQLSTALSEKSAYREALDEIVYCGSMGVAEVIARRALDRKPEEPVGREVTREELIDELAKGFAFNEDLAAHILTTFLIVERR